MCWLRGAQEARKPLLNRVWIRCFVANVASPFQLTIIWEPVNNFTVRFVIVEANHRFILHLRCMVIANLWRFQSCLSLYRLQLASCAMQSRGMAWYHRARCGLFAQCFRDQHLTMQNTNSRIPRKNINARLPAVIALPTVVQVPSKPYSEFLSRRHGQWRWHVVKCEYRSVNTDTVKLIWIVCTTNTISSVFCQLQGCLVLERYNGSQLLVPIWFVGTSPMRCSYVFWTAYVAVQVSEFKRVD